MAQETQHERLRREHAEMLDLLRIFANKVIPSRITLASEYYAGYYDAYEVVQSDVNDVLQAITATPPPDSAAAALAESERYPRYVLELADSTNGIADAWSIVDNETGMYVAHTIYASEDTMQAECNRLNAAHAASPDTGNAVAGSGNGGES